MNTSKNKIILLIAVVFCLSAFVFVGIQFIKNNKPASKESKDNGSNYEAVKNQSPESCSDKIQKMNNEDLVKYVLSIPDDAGMNSSQVKKNDYDSYVLTRYLKCQYEESNNEQEKEKFFNDAASILDSTLAKEGAGRIATIVKENFKNPEKSFSYRLFLADFDAFCPNELPKMCERENGTMFMESAEWCNNICATLMRYKNDGNSFNREVVDLSNIDASMKDKFFTYGWRLPLTFGLRGKTEALKICGNIPENFHYPCILQISSFEARSINCNDITNKLKTELCSI